MSCRLAKLRCCRFQQGLQCSQTGFLHCCVPWTAKLFQWCDLINCRIVQALQKKHTRLEAPQAPIDDSEAIFSLSILQTIILTLHKPIHHMFYLYIHACSIRTATNSGHPSWTATRRASLVAVKHFRLQGNKKSDPSRPPQKLGSLAAPKEKQHPEW